jgi:hypothetical protein
VSQKCFWRGLSQKGNFDGLHKQLKNAFGKITKKGNFLKRKLYAKELGKMPEKS